MQLEFGGQRISAAAGQLLIGSDLAAAVGMGGDDVLPSHVLLRVADEGSLAIEPTVSGVGAPRGVTGGVAAQPAVDGHSRLVALSDGREYPIDAVPFVMGRIETAQVVIGSPDASRRHAEIVATPSGDVLVDLSTHGTVVNGSRINGRYQLGALDVIRIGADEFRYYPGDRLKAVPPPGAQFRLSDTLVGLPVRTLVASVPTADLVRPLAVLLAKSGALKGQRFNVRQAAAVIGRDPEADVRLVEPSVSARHGRLELREGIWSLTDLGSGSGSWVDDERVSDEFPLSPGAVIRIGDVALSFEPRDERAVPSAPAQVAASLAALAPAGRPAPIPGAVLPEPVPDPIGGPSPVVVGLAILILIAGLSAVVLLG